MMNTVTEYFLRVAARYGEVGSKSSDYRRYKRPKSLVAVKWCFFHKK